MPTPTLSEALDNLYTTTWKHRKSSVADQIFDATPFWFWLRRNNRLESIEGGRFIVEPLSFAKSDNVKWIGRGGTVQLDDKEFLTTATYNWKYLVDSIVRFGQDDQKNRGRAAVVSLMNAKLDNSRDSLIDELEIRLFGTAGTDQMNGLLDIVPDDPTVAASALGGLDPSVYTWWRSKTDNMTGVQFSTSGITRMRTMLNNCSQNRGQDRPDIIISGQTNFERYEDELLDIKRVTSNELADAGFKTVEFEGIPWFWSPQCANTRIYFINSRFLSLKYDPIMFFDMTEWKAIPDQVQDRAAQIITACNLTTNRRRVHGVIYNQDTA